MKSNQGKLFEQLRKDFPEFTYEEYSYSVTHNELHIYFHFRMGEKYYFKPTHIFHLPPNFDDKKLSDSLFRNMIFNLGMIELISYWKAACPPKLIIKTARLTADQVAFWEKLYLHGLGEFFFLNGIDPGTDLFEIISSGTEIHEKAECENFDKDAVLIPIGGGKDSVVTLELLNRIKNGRPYIMNPRPASMMTATVAGYTEKDLITSKRIIDSRLLEMNAEGFLNGHTPFSAMLAFTSLLVAYLNDIPEIALSNESSANEPTIPGTKINHQYSKSLEFENDFREYVFTNITDSIHYYSFLRPLNELQIAKIFSSFRQHHSSFRSCNVGSKTNSWCGKCPKCLFTAIILLPFIYNSDISKIFGSKILDDLNLTDTLDQLCGWTEEKPFECIGTLSEVNAAISFYINLEQSEGRPELIEYYLKRKETIEQDNETYFQLLKDFSEHNIPGLEQLKLLKEAINAD